MFRDFLTPLFLSAWQLEYIKHENYFTERVVILEQYMGATYDVLGNGPVLSIFHGIIPLK